MSKAITNQRHVFKINSTRFKVKKWNLELSIEEAKINQEIVSIGDSTCLRIIRELVGDTTTEEEIFDIKNNIKKLKKEKSTSSIKKEIVKQYNILEEKILMKDYLLIVFDSVTDFNRATNTKKTLVFNNKEYVRLLGTSGGLKKNVVVFVSKDIHQKLNSRLNNDRDVSQKYVPAKFEAYKALACSASVPVTQPKGVLVIKDGVVKIEGKVIKLSDNGIGGFNIDKNCNYSMKKMFCDGCGMIDPKLSEQWAIDLGEYTINQTTNKKIANYIPSGFNIRNFATKGMVGSYDFKLCVKTILQKEKVFIEDYWGNNIDIDTVDIVITDNMLKLANGYSSIGDYIEKCNKNGFGFCVAKMLPKQLEKVRNMNYQFMQSYEFSDEDIDELIKPTIDNIYGAVCGDYAKTLLFLKGDNITYKDFEREEIGYIKALMISEEMLDEPYIKNRVKKMISKRINEAKKGVLQVRGNYSIIFGDLYALCQHMCKVEITGLLNYGEFYSNTWSNIGAKEIVSFRAPMTVHNNIKKMNLINNDKINFWYKYMPVCTIFNSFDFTTEALNGCDMDGDAIISSDSLVLRKNTVDMLPIICEQKSSEKIVIDKESILKESNKHGFNNNVGKVTNRCTAMYDVLSKFKKGSYEYEVMLNRIMCMQGYQQEIIDSIKGIIPKEVPKEWYDHKYLNRLFREYEKNEWETDELLINKKLLANKKPYFFKYNYKHLKVKNDNYISNCEKNCLYKFGKSINELDENIASEADFLNYYEEMNILSLQSSTMNRVCWRLEELLDCNNFKTIENNSFYTSLLPIGYKPSDNKIKKIESVYKNYKKEISSYLKTTHSKDDSKDENNSSKNIYIDTKRKELLQIESNEDNLCNILLYLINKDSNIKQFLWTMCSETMINKLLLKNNNKINIIIKDSNGEVEWMGDKYSVKRIDYRRRD